MQDKREYTGEEHQHNQSSGSGFSPGSDKNQVQQMGQDRPLQEKRSTLEPSEIDQQEGNMNNGTLGGNFGEDLGNSRDQHVPPY